MSRANRKVMHPEQSEGTTGRFLRKLNINPEADKERKGRKKHKSNCPKGRVNRVLWDEILNE